MKTQLPRMDHKPKHKFKPEAINDSLPICFSLLVQLSEVRLGLLQKCLTSVYDT